MPHLLRDSVVPVFLENRPAPAMRGGSLLYGVAKAIFAVGRQRISHVQISISHATLAVNFCTIRHPAALSPTAFDHAQRLIFELNNADRLVISLGLVGVHVSPKLS